MTLLSVTKARQKLLDALSPLEKVNVPLHQAAGRVLFEPIASPSDLPRFSNSSMDGFAAHAFDIVRASAEKPITLPVVADIPAGQTTTTMLMPGKAARIMTGAPVPKGANAVVPLEDTNFQPRNAGAEAPEWVRIYRAVKSGSYIRQKGEDVRAGDIVLAPGQRLRPQDVGLLAMLGMAEVPVYRQPRVGVLSTGDELLPVDAQPAPGKIFESNTYALSALVAAAGGEPIHLGIAADQAEAIKQHLDKAVEANVDLIISSAGVSVGAFDFVRSVVETHGELSFWRVNMRPGKPLAFGAYRGIPFVGLPGNPVSSFMGFEVFVRPAVGKLSGFAYERTVWEGQLAEAVESDGRESYLRAVISHEDGLWRARLTGHQGSGNQFSLVQANALVIIPAGVKSLPEGAAVEIWPL